MEEESKVEKFDDVKTRVSVFVCVCAVFVVSLSKYIAVKCNLLCRYYGTILKKLV